MEQPLVSILTPFKNTSEYLEACLDSILIQSYTNWELLIIDDWSTDNSYTIVDEYQQKDSRIRLFKNKGQGIIEALRTAYHKANGQLITRMDSDDIMTSDKLKIMVNSLNTYGRGHVAVGKVKYFSDVGISDGYSRYEIWLNALTEQGSNYAEIYKECVIPSPCWMLYKEDLDRCGAFLPNRYPEDYDLTFRFYEAQLKCIPCDKVLHLWRDYSTRTSRTHEHYAQNYFLEIKLHYFLKLDYKPSADLVVWGAGFKGKTIAKSLIDQNIEFYWICDNPKKIGKDIYGKTLLGFEYIQSLETLQSIVTVANEAEQQTIKAYLNTQKLVGMKDYFFFC